VPNVTITSGIARWDGTSWGSLNGLLRDRGVNGANVSTMVLDGRGNLYVGGNFASVGTVVPAANVARWNGVAATAAEKGALPATFQLTPAYPTPFNPSTRFSVILGRPGEVRIGIFDVLGREVARLHDGNLSAGQHAFTWEAHEMGSGIYLVRAIFGSSLVAQRVVLLR